MVQDCEGPLYKLQQRITALKLGLLKNGIRQPEQSEAFV